MRILLLFLALNSAISFSQTNLSIIKWPFDKYELDSTQHSELNALICDLQSQIESLELFSIIENKKCISFDLIPNFKDVKGMDFPDIKNGITRVEKNHYIQVFQNSDTETMAKSYDGFADSTFMLEDGSFYYKLNNNYFARPFGLEDIESLEIILNQDENATYFGFHLKRAYLNLNTTYMRIDKLQQYDLLIQHIIEKGIRVKKKRC